MDVDSFTSPPKSLKHKLKHSLCFSCCFRRHHRLDSPPPQSPSDENPAVTWMKPRSQDDSVIHDIKQKCQNMLRLVGNGPNRHKRYSSAEFGYDPLSYSLNFEDGCDHEDEAVPLRDFAARLTPVKTVAATSQMADGS